VRQGEKKGQYSSTDILYLQKSAESQPRECVSHFGLAWCRSSFLPPSFSPSLLPLLLLLLLPQPVTLTRRGGRGGGGGGGGRGGGGGTARSPVLRSLPTSSLLPSLPPSLPPCPGTSNDGFLDSLLDLGATAVFPKNGPIWGGQGGRKGGREGRVEYQGGK
jgi:hypothetical protein